MATEAGVGITEYVSPDAVGFTGLIKHRCAGGALRCARRALRCHRMQLQQDRAPPHTALPPPGLPTSRCQRWVLMGPWRG